MSPSLFNLYINDMRKSGYGIHVDCDSEKVEVPALAYADDIALVTPTPNALQSMLAIMDEWYEHNGISINVSKTKIMHFRRKGRCCSTYNFIC